MLYMYVRKMKAMTVTMVRVTGEDNILHALCTKCMKLTVKYIFCADILFWVQSF